MNSHESSRRRPRRFQHLARNLHCVPLVAGALLFSIPLQGGSAFSVAVGDSGKGTAETGEGVHSSDVLGCGLDAFCSLLGIANSVTSTEDADSCQSCYPLKAAGAGERVEVYTAGNSEPEQFEGRRQHLRPAPSPKPAMPARALRGKVEGLTVQRRLGENISTTSLVAPAHQSLADIEDYKDSNTPPAVWVSPQDAQVEPSPVDYIESDAPASSTQSDSGEAVSETPTEDEVVSSQSFGCKHGSCLRVRGTIRIPGDFPPAPTYTTNIFPPPPVQAVPIPIPYPAHPYHTWPSPYSPYSLPPYQGLLYGPNSWYSTSQASTTQSATYGGGFNSWAGMGYDPYMY